jgi:hypothetical protein
MDREKPKKVTRNLSNTTVVIFLKYVFSFLPFDISQGCFVAEYRSVEEGSVLGGHVLQQNLRPRI